jgi:hypothetical protein
MADWYIESWAVRDGFAFASQRPPRKIEATERTVFIGVPDLVPVPIGRVSTALRATRANFQDGFVDPKDGGEIAFATLDEVIELVRRAYLGSGAGPAPAGAEGPQRPLDAPSGAGDLYLRRGLQQLDPAPAWFVGSYGIADTGKRQKNFADLGRDRHALGELREYVRLFAEASLIKWAEELLDRRRKAEEDYERDDDLSVGDFMQWLGILRNAGLLESPLPVIDRLREDGPNEIADLLEELLYGGFASRTSWWTSSRGWGATATNEQIVMQVPCPLLAHWHPQTRRLAEKVFLGVSTWDYFENNPGLAEFIPALLASIAVVVQTEGDTLDPYSERAWTRRVNAALTWLSKQMPQIHLPDTAEEAITKFAWGELDRR